VAIITEFFFLVFFVFPTLFLKRPCSLVWGAGLWAAWFAAGPGPPPPYVARDVFLKLG